MFGTTQVPTDTFNKVWIVPDKARIYENGDKAFIVESKLKVMLEEDYVAQQAQDSKGKSQSENQPLNTNGQIPATKNSLSSQIVREIVLPALEKKSTRQEFCSTASGL